MTPRPPRRRTSSARPHIRGRGALRFCLLLLLWQAPLPWWHSHAAMRLSENGRQCLAEHLRRFHAGADASNLATAEAAATCLHLHFLLPGSLPAGEDSEGPSAPHRHGPPSYDRAPESTHELSRLMAAGRLTPADLARPVPPIFSVGLSGIPPLPTQFLEHFSAARSLPERLGVSRC